MTALAASGGVPTSTRTSPTCCPCWDRPSLAGVLFPVGEMTKSDVRAHAARLGLRTAGKPDSQDVCFIGSARGPAGVPRPTGWSSTPPRWSTRRGEAVGTVDAVELVTVGQRRGMGHGTDGGPPLRGGRRRAGPPGHGRERRRGRHRPPWSCPAPPSPGSTSRSCTGDRAVAQVSAHGRPAACAVAGWTTRWSSGSTCPSGPWRPGQTVALYDVADPDAVVGAGIAA